MSLESCSTTPLVEQDFGRDVAGYRRPPEGVEGCGVEAVDSLCYPPRSQSSQDADVRRQFS